MSTQKVRIGIIGSGGIAQGVHIPGWKAIPNVEIVAVADVNENNARRAAEISGATEVFTDYRDLLKLDLDAVDVCTPNKVHTPAVLAALASGKHVLCEKPLAVTTKEVREMGEAADAAGLVLMTGQHQRYRSETLAIKQWASTGNLGDVYHARVRAMRRAFLPGNPGFIDQNLSGGGPCMDIGVHALDAALWIMGFPKPVRVSGTARTNFAKGHKIPGKWGEWNRELYSVEDFAAAFVHFENGATLTIEAAWLGHQKSDEDFSFELFGTEAGVHWPSGEIASVHNGVFIDGHLSCARKVDKPHAAEIRDFYDAFTTGGRSPVPWTESIYVIAILEAIYESHRQGCEIQIGDLGTERLGIPASRIPATVLSTNPL